MARQLRVPENLKEEIIEIYHQNMERPSNEILVTLNAPHRIQERGFVVDASHLLGVIIDSWHVGRRTRFALYDYDMMEMCTREVYDNVEEAREEANSRAPEVQVVRFEV